MNTFFEETLLLLLELDLRGYTMDRRLKPLFAYLKKQLTLFDQFLIPECNKSVKQTFWKYAVKVSRTTIFSLSDISLWYLLKLIGCKWIGMNECFGKLVV